jgi:hypothetical protein
VKLVPLIEELEALVSKHQTYYNMTSPSFEASMKYRFIKINFEISSVPNTLTCEIVVLTSFCIIHFAFLPYQNPTQ